MKTKTSITRKTFAFAYVLLAVVLLSGCFKDQDPKEIIQNGNFTVEFLFEQNGCKMYRFKDGGRYIYWSDCQGKVQSDYTTQSGSGKTTISHHVESVTSE